MKKIIITILLVALCLGIVGGGIAGIVKLTDTGKLDTKTISSTKFSVGGLDSNGKYMNTNASIYTKEAFECQGLEVSLDFDNEVEYQIYFYDQNNDFVHTTGKLSGAFVKDSVPFFAKYARIVVTPKNDEVVSNLEVLKYAGQLTVKVNREQGFKNYTEDLVVVKEGYSINAETGAYTVSDTFNSCEKIDISSYSNGLLFRSSSDMSTLLITLYDDSGKYIRSTFMTESADKYISSLGVIYYLVSFDNYSDVKFIATNWGSTADKPIIQCR